jgi:RNA polymerase sigma factor (sigma-70 family)
VEPSDEMLVQACLRGDNAAWETLVLRYQRLIYSIPRRAGLSEDLASEVFQHVFATLVEQLPTIKQPDRIKAWLVTTARRESWRVSRQQRAMGPKPTVSDGSGTVDVDTPDNDPLPEEVVVRLEQQDAIRQAMQQLDERCRRLLTLLFYTPEPPAYADIARELGTSEGSIGPTRARCLEKLRHGLSESDR